MAGSTSSDAPPAVGAGGAVAVETTVVEQAGELRSARIESVRAVAALAVLVGHVFGAAHRYGPSAFDGFLRRTLFGGGFGVFLFFALSGYLLTWPLVRQHLGGGARVDLATYARNRAVRILPLYYLVMVLLLVVQEGGGSFTQWWRFMLFAQNFSEETVGTVNGVTWSLVVELHFYAVLPFLVAGVVRLAGRDPRRVALLLAAAGLASLAWRVATVQLDRTPGILWRYSTLTTFGFFVPGMLLALWRLSWERRPPRWRRGVAGAADAWLLLSVPLWLLVFARYEWEVLCALASFLVVGAVVLPLRAGPLVRLLDRRPLVAIGIASYSLYLWHVPIIENFRETAAAPEGFLPLLATTGPACVVVALVSYRLLEAPWLRLRQRWVR